MSFILRPARLDDMEHLYEMAKLTGGGFTNLPADRISLAGKVEHSVAAFNRTDETLDDDLFVLVLENPETGAVRGTCQMMSMVGQRWPFYSYRLSSQTKHSEQLDRTVRAEILSLVTDLEGSSEVGGLFLHPNDRAGGNGLLLARSRYLFIAMHRARFADRVLAELRGIIDDRGGSPFWDGVAGRFFGMGFQEADEFNAIHGNQFIADLMPKFPIYVSMLSDDARRVIGMPHPKGRAAMRMLENEGFAYENYVDIFDGGPTMIARTDQVRSVADAECRPLVSRSLENGEKAIVATGHLESFRACWGTRELLSDGGVALDAKSAAMLNVSPGDIVWSVPR